MQIIRRTRQGGKTTEAVEWVKADSDNRVLICPNESMAAWTRQFFDLTPRQCMGAHSAFTRLRGRRVNIGLDNAELFRWQDMLMLGAFYNDIELATETG